MKYLVLGGLSALLLSATSTPGVMAQSNTPNSVVNTRESEALIEPFQLVYMAYQGYFEEQGIPSYTGLIQAYNFGQVDARDIVSSAVQANRIPAQILNDESYINAVDNFLSDLRNEGQG
ncbi:hypothetical protein [Floridanema aerugineum]|jgi:hypothetical protein|uniref:Uncharacterized protein n=1 Tax=Floridaenema aerugineum BLCC-F46 TaxID=3153654 RepID=A0ABV4X2S8_9CYAN